MRKGEVICNFGNYIIGSLYIYMVKYDIFIDDSAKFIKGERGM